MRITQWFERAHFEWHPDKPAEFRVLLGLLGNELRGLDAGTATAPTSFGVEINRGAVARVAGRLGELGVTQVRYNGILWAEVEPTRGARRWDALASVEGELAAISAAGAAPAVIIRSAPKWPDRCAAAPAARSGPRLCPTSLPS